MIRPRRTGNVAHLLGGERGEKSSKTDEKSKRDGISAGTFETIDSNVDSNNCS